MQTGGMAATSVVPLMRYRDCAAAIDWLGKAFGFERHFVVGSDNGEVAYAQMTQGAGMIMLGPVGKTDLDSYLKQPAEVGGSATQCCYLAVENIEAHYARARENGAEIVLELKSGAFGSRGYSCRDPEGHIWNFGSYNPWRGKRLPQAAVPRTAKSTRRGILREVVVLGLCLSALAVTLSTLGRDWMAPLVRIQAAWTPLDASGQTGVDLARADASRMAAELAASKAQQALAKSESARAAAEALLSEAKLDVERERAGRMRADQGASAAVESMAADVRNELQSERSSRARAEQQSKAAEVGLTQERAARQAVELTVEELKGRLAVETRARQDAEAQANRVRGQLSRIEEAPKPAGSVSVLTGSAADHAPVTADKPPGAESVAQKDASAAALAGQDVAKPATPQSQSLARVGSWEMRDKDTPAKRKKYVSASKKVKQQAASATPYKPKTPKPAKLQEGPYFNVY